MENAETLIYIEIKRIMIFSALYLCIAKQSFTTSSLVLKANIVLNISDVVLQTDNSTVKYEGPIIFYCFVQKLTFLPQISYETSCILKIYLGIYLPWQKCYELH